MLLFLDIKSDGVTVNLMLKNLALNYDYSDFANYDKYIYIKFMCDRYLYLFLIISLHCELVFNLGM
jgi:hypothetical protein